MRVGAYLVLVIVTGLLFGCSYYYLVFSVKHRLTIEYQQINSQVQEINKLQAAYPKSLSIENIEDYDKVYGTNFSAAIMHVAPAKEYVAQASAPFPEEIKQLNPINEKLEAMKTEKLDKLFKIEDVLDWWSRVLSYLPPFSVIILAGFGIFFTSLINNFGDYCFKKFFKKSKQ